MISQQPGQAGVQPACPIYQSIPPLVIGFGNSLRRDDGIGWWIAGRLAEDPRAAGISSIATTQLTPELAQDLASASRVIFVDATLSDAPPVYPGHARVSRLTCPGSPNQQASSHHCSPDALLDLCAQFFGPPPPAWLVIVDIADTGPGTALTAQLAAALPRLTGLVLALALFRSCPMHEMSLISELVELCLARAAQAPSPVAAIRVRHSSTIPTEALHTAFAMLAADTPLAGIPLLTEVYDTLLNCPSCHAVSVLDHDDVISSVAACPICGEISEIPHPAELELSGLDLAG